LFDNPVIQPANLAIRGAWFSGGVEWNGPILGHSPLTCSPVFFGIVETRRGRLIRIYEFDRLFETTWQVDIFLPVDSDKLWIHVKVRNTTERDVNYYWWTNIAVPLTTDTRVLAPADYSISHLPSGNRRAPFPYRDGKDYSYPRNIHHADSIFFRAPNNNRPWAAAVDKHGRGLIYTSTQTLSGRKFWVWGNTRGGKHWMDYLSLPGQGDYIEIQGGLTPTQLQTRPLRAGQSLEWTECLCALDLDPRLAHQPDWHAAVKAGWRWLDEHLPQSLITETDAFLRAHSDKPLSKVLHRGSAWGWLHEKRTGKKISAALNFGTKCSESESHWAELLRSGTFSPQSLAQSPRSWITSEGWLKVLEQSAAKHGATWLHHLYIGVAQLESGFFSKARQRFVRALQLRDNWLAWRNLALLHDRDGDADAARESYQRAWTLSHGYSNLAVEICEFLFRRQMRRALDEFLGALKADVKSHERIQLVMAKLALRRDDFQFVRKVLNRQFATIREGEVGLTDLWQEMRLKQAARKKGRSLTFAEMDAHLAATPPPWHLDFRMNPAAPKKKK
jgi:tetratricopeptide (TPR) repeat protein